MDTNTQSLATTGRKDISTIVLQKIDAFKKSGQLTLPKDYSAENALKSAYLVLAETKNKAGNLALEHCSRESIANALLKMVVWGLSPLKKQCSFIMYGKSLDCAIEYTGNIVLAKRYGNLKSIKANSIFEGDEFAFEVLADGSKRIIKHVQTLDSIGSKVVKGAYAVFEMNDGRIDTEIMNMSQIRSAWAQGANGGASPAHKNFPDQMANKTVINRACKLLIRSSDDSVLYDDSDDRIIDASAEDVDYEIEVNANKEELSIDIEHTEHVEQVGQEIEVHANGQEVATEGPGF